jgi:transcriptional regulator GlxA family with amidase domain
VNPVAPPLLAQLALECGFNDRAAFRATIEERFHSRPESILSLPDPLV